MELAAIWDAPLVGLDVEPDSVEELEAPVPAAAEPVAPVALALAAPGVGEPKRVTPDWTGPGRAEAEPPTPTKLPLLSSEGPV